MIVLIKVFDQIIKVKKSEVRLRRYCNFKKLSIVSPLTWINFWRFYFLKNNFQKSIFFQKFQKKCRKISKENFRKKIFKTFCVNPIPHGFFSLATHGGSRICSVLEKLNISLRKLWNVVKSSLNWNSSIFQRIPSIFWTIRRFLVTF